MSWKDFETECLNYIKSVLEYQYSSSLEGGSDSTTSDILISKNNKALFYVEAKEDPSQAGQFVVVDGGNSFSFSSKNVCKKECCIPFVDFLNQHYTNYKDVKQGALPIGIDSTISYHRIISFYKNEKNAPFFITKKENDFLVFPVDDLQQYFDISCVLRRKKSGSRDLPRSHFDEAKDAISHYFENKALNFKLSSSDKKYFIKVGTNNQFDKLKIPTKDHSLYFSKSSENEYVIKILSNTNNPNIIFSLVLKNGDLVNQIDKLKKYLEKY